MSAFLDKAEAIKTRLEAISALSSVTVLIDNQKEIASDFRKAMAKTKGAAVIIFFDGYETYEDDVAESEVVSNFVVTIWTKPILRDGETPAYDLVSEVHRSLHGWQSEQLCRNKAAVTSGRVIPNQQFLIHQINL